MAERSRKRRKKCAAPFAETRTDASVKTSKPKWSYPCRDAVDDRDEDEDNKLCEDGWIDPLSGAVGLTSTPWIRNKNKGDPLGLLSECGKTQLVECSDYRTLQMAMSTLSTRKDKDACAVLKSRHPCLIYRNSIPEESGTWEHHVFALDNADFYLILVTETGTGNYDDHYYLPSGSVEWGKETE